MNYKYTEIMDFLRYEIDREVYKDKLPSIRALAIKFSCSILNKDVHYENNINR